MLSYELVKNVVPVSEFTIFVEIQMVTFAIKLSSGGEGYNNKGPGHFDCNVIY